MKIRIILVSVIFLSSFKGSSQYLKDITNQFDSLISFYGNSTLMPGISMGAVKDGEVVYSNGFGFTDRKHTEAVTKNTIFHSASITKVFTATAIMQLVERELIDIEKEITFYLPEVGRIHSDFNKITVKQLLNHTSGLSDVKNYKWSQSNRSPTAIQDYVTGLKPKKIRYQPGTYHYSNIGYTILGYLIERIASESFEDYLGEHVLLKAEMNSSTLDFNPTDDWAQPFSKRKLSGKIYQRSVYPYSRQHAPSSTLHTSVQDLNSWMLHLLNIYHTKNDGIITAETLRMMWTTSLPTDTKIGLGWSLGKYKDHDIVYHFGGDKGFRSFLVIFPESNIGVTILMNGDFAEELRQKITFLIADKLLQY